MDTELVNPAIQTPPPGEKPTWKQFEDEIGTKYETWAAAQDAYADARDAWKDAQGQQAQSEWRVR